MTRNCPDSTLMALARELVRCRYPLATSAYTKDGAAIYDATDTLLGSASAGDWAVEYAWQDAARKLLPVGVSLDDEHLSWLAKFTAALQSAVSEGIYAERYSDYPSIVEGFCFELAGDLPHHRPLFRTHILTQLASRPQYQALEHQFEEKYGRRALLTSDMFEIQKG